MIKPITYRKAKRGDSRFIAEMIEISSDGVASIEWEKEAELGTSITAIDIGSQLYSQEQGDYSYRNCLIAESHEPVGMVLAFPITAQNFSANAKAPPYEKHEVFAPYQYLEALDSWYICGLAVLPDYREQGIASRLLEQSVQQGRDQGLQNISLVAMMEKSELIRFYETRGFHITRSAPIVEHPAIRVKGLAALMETNPNQSPLSRSVLH